MASHSCPRCSPSVREQTFHRPGPCPTTVRNALKPRDLFDGEELVDGDPVGGEPITLAMIGPGIDTSDIEKFEP